MNYADCVREFAKRRPGSDSKKLGNNAYLTQDRDYGDVIYSVRYHNTDILTFWPDGRIGVNNGGFFTVTTKARLNEYGPISFYQRRGTWYFMHDGREHQFDGILSIHADGSIVQDGATV
jgi:hypothetical protein